MAKARVLNYDNDPHTTLSVDLKNFALDGDLVALEAKGQGKYDAMKWLALSVMGLGALLVFMVSEESSAATTTGGLSNSGNWAQGAATRRLLASNKTCPEKLFDGCTCELAPQKEVWEVVLEWLAIVLLVSLSALFSGLTLGLMSLDLIGLDIVIGGDPDSSEAKYAKAIKPIRARGNLLLCTLLLGNVAVNSALSILLAAYTGGVYGFIASTLVIVVFGEIFPQATCSRHALYVGYLTLPIVKFFLIIMFPIAFPISWVLNLIFKEEIGNVYSTGELHQLVEIHKTHKTVDEAQAKMMGGALSYREKTVKDVMTDKKSIFMLSAEDTLSFETLSKIFRAGCSRIPVHANNDRNDVVGLLLTKDLILIDPEDNISVSSVIQFFGREVFYLWPDTKLPEALKMFRSGRTHMAVVRNVNNEVEDRDPFYEIVGLVTLEDIIEEILQEEILDETDAPEADEADKLTDEDNLDLTNPAGSKVDRATFDFALLRLLDTRSHVNELSDSEVNAIVAHLSANLLFFKGALEHGKITSQQVRTLVTQNPVLALKPGELLYKAGRPLDHCTLVLSGSLEVVSGSEGFRSTVGAWSLVGQSSLNLEKPGGQLCDFTATVKSEEGLRCMRINRTVFESMLSGETPVLNGNGSLSASAPSSFGSTPPPRRASEVGERLLNHTSFHTKNG